MHHHHRREGAFALRQRQKAARGVLLAFAQGDRFLDIAALVRRFAVLVRAHGGKAQRAEPALRVERQRHGGVGIGKRAIGDGHAVIALRAGVRRLNALKRAERAGELRPDGGQTVRAAEGFVHGLVRILKDGRVVALRELCKHRFRQVGGIRFRQRRQREKTERNGHQKCQYTAHIRTPFWRSLYQRRIIPATAFAPKARFARRDDALPAQTPAREREKHLYYSSFSRVCR